MYPHPTSQLHADTIYLAEDRFVCGRIRCAGYAAKYTGRTIAGVEVVPVEWAARDLGWDPSDADPITCECGAVTYRVTHGTHPADGLALCATAEDSPALTDDPQAVTCPQCLDAL